MRNPCGNPGVRLAGQRGELTLQAMIALTVRRQGVEFERVTGVHGGSPLGRARQRRGGRAGAETPARYAASSRESGSSMATRRAPPRSSPRCSGADWQCLRVPPRRCGRERHSSPGDCGGVVDDSACSSCLLLRVIILAQTRAQIGEYGGVLVGMFAPPECGMAWMPDEPEAVLQQAATDGL